MTGLDDLDTPYEISNNHDIQRVLGHLIEEAAKVGDAQDLGAAREIADNVAAELTRLRSALNY